MRFCNKWKVKYLLCLCTFLIVAFFFSSREVLAEGSCASGYYCYGSTVQDIPMGCSRVGNHCEGYSAKVLVEKREFGYTGKKPLKREAL